MLNPCQIKFRLIILKERKRMKSKTKERIFWEGLMVFERKKAKTKIKINKEV